MNQISLLNWMLLSTALLGAWWLCYRLALRSERSFAYNRAFLVLGPLLAAGLPLLPLAWPAGWWDTGPAGLAGVAAVLLPAAQVSAAGGAVEAANPNWAFWLLAVYVTGVAVMILRLGAELGRLWWQARKLPHKIQADYTLVETHGQLPTSSFGRVVFWDETLGLNPAEARQVLAHELAHVRQHHTYDRLLLELLRAALWFNPFVHLCARALALTHEYLADAAALHESPSPTPSLSTSYSQLLARQVASRLGFSVPLAHSFSHSQTLSRIAMIQKTNPIRRWKQWLALPLLGVLLVAVACEKAAPPATSADVVSETIAINKEGSAPPPPLAVPQAGNRISATPVPSAVYTYVDHMPQLPGGSTMADVAAFIQQRVAYPKLPVASQHTGMVFASFIVNDKGEVQAAKIIKGLAPEYDEAVLAAIRQLPRMEPGRQADGTPANVSLTLPIKFATAPAK
ncbi:M56 family metallopeptidase [Hymenobacter glaciei]|uniref:M56 family metallopeptidase n=1 Tax=Hymenobacter glaciei TaxID=877209 RepID=A0ABP7U9A6_9BACT